ncbi:MAG: hypothetical protein D6772_11940, partial [Bacteroidetes bacterium]
MVLSFLSLPLLAQSLWQWGASWQVGKSGEQVAEQYEFSRPGVNVLRFTKNSQAACLFAGGLWTAYQLSSHWSLQLAAQYHRLHTRIESQSLLYNAANTLLSASYGEEQLYQHSIEIPLRLRFYIHTFQHRLRPFLGLQAGLAYLAAGKLLVRSQNLNLATGDITSIS